MNNSISSMDAAPAVDQLPLANDASKAEPTSLQRVSCPKNGNVSRGRVVSRAEVIRIVDEIMRRAEEGRIAAAEDEAKRQFDMESLS